MRRAPAIPKRIRIPDLVVYVATNGSAACSHRHVSVDAAVRCARRRGFSQVQTVSDLYVCDVLLR